MEFNATFLATAISFIVFVFIMNNIFYKPLEKVVKEREKVIGGNYDEAKENNDKASFLIKDRAEKIAEANFEGKNILSQKTNKAKDEKTKLVNNASKIAVEKIETAKNELDGTEKELKNSLKGNIVDLAREISTKIVGDKVNLGDENSDFVEKIMEEN